VNNLFAIKHGKSRRWETIFRHILALGLIATVAGCSHSTDTNAPAAGASSSRNPASPGPQSAASAAAGMLVPAKSTYEVTLKPETTVIDADTMTHAYRGAASDGTLTFDAASAPSVAAIKPGTVVIFAGVAMLRVTKLNSSGGTLSVAGTPVGLEDTIDHGHIAWSAPLDFGKVAFIPPPGFHRVSGGTGPLLALVDMLVPRAEAGLSLANNTWDGAVKEWKISIALTPSNGDLHLDLHATKTIDGGTIDVHGVGQFNGLTNEGSITLANGTTTEITFDNKKLNGTVDFYWKVAFDAEHGGSKPEMRESDTINLPFAMEIPFVLGPIPFKLNFKTAFAFQPTFTSKVTVAQGSYHGAFRGAVAMTDSADSNSSDPAAGAASAAAPPANAPAADGDADSATAEGTINSYGGTLSIAAVGLSTTVAMPKISLTIGLPGPLSALLPTSDMGGPYATFMTQANFIATGSTTIVQCEKRELNLFIAVGYTPGLLGKLKLKPQSKTILHKTYSEVRPPNITLCQ
jgi:hypothetical protein